MPHHKSSFLRRLRRKLKLSAASLSDQSNLLMMGNKRPLPVRRTSAANHSVDNNNSDEAAKQCLYQQVRITALPVNYPSEHTNNNNNNNNTHTATTHNLPLTLGRKNMAHWWWNACNSSHGGCSSQENGDNVSLVDKQQDRSSQKRKRQRRHHFCARHCRPLAEEVGCLSKAMIRVTTQGTVQRVGKNPQFIHIFTNTNNADGAVDVDGEENAPHQNAIVERKTVLISIGREGGNPWMQFRMEMVPNETVPPKTKDEDKQQPSTTGNSKKRRTSVTPSPATKKASEACGGFRRNKEEEISKSMDLSPNSPLSVFSPEWCFPATEAAIKLRQNKSPQQQHQRKRPRTLKFPDEWKAVDRYSKQPQQQQQQQCRKLREPAPASWDTNSEDTNRAQRSSSSSFRQEARSARHDKLGRPTTPPRRRPFSTSRKLLSTTPPSPSQEREEQPQQPALKSKGDNTTTVRSSLLEVHKEIMTTTRIAQTLSALSDQSDDDNNDNHDDNTDGTGQNISLLDQAKLDAETSTAQATTNSLTQGSKQEIIQLLMELKRQEATTTSKPTIGAKSPPTKEPMERHCRENMGDCNAFGQGDVCSHPKNGLSATWSQDKALSSTEKPSVSHTETVASRNPKRGATYTQQQTLTRVCPQSQRNDKILPLVHSQRGRGKSDLLRVGTQTDGTESCSHRETPLSNTQEETMFSQRIGSQKGEEQRTQAAGNEHHPGTLQYCQQDSQDATCNTSSNHSPKSKAGSQHIFSQMNAKTDLSSQEYQPRVGLPSVSFGHLLLSTQTQFSQTLAPQAGYASQLSQKLCQGKISNANVDNSSSSEVSMIGSQEQARPFARASLSLSYQPDSKADMGAKSQPYSAEGIYRQKSQPRGLGEAKEGSSSHLPLQKCNSTESGASSEASSVLDLPMCDNRFSTQSSLMVLDNGDTQQQHRDSSLDFPSMHISAEPDLLSHWQELQRAEAGRSKASRALISLVVEKNQGSGDPFWLPSILDDC